MDGRRWRRGQYKKGPRNKDRSRNPKRRFHQHGVGRKEKGVSRTVDVVTQQNRTGASSELRYGRTRDERLETGSYGNTSDRGRKRTSEEYHRVEVKRQRTGVHQRIGDRRDVHQRTNFPKENLRRAWIEDDEQGLGPSTRGLIKERTGGSPPSFTEIKGSSFKENHSFNLSNQRYDVAASNTQRARQDQNCYHSQADGLLQRRNEDSKTRNQNNTFKDQVIRFHNEDYGFPTNQDFSEDKKSLRYYGNQIAPKSHMNPNHNERYHSLDVQCADNKCNPSQALHTIETPLPGPFPSTPRDIPDEKYLQKCPESEKEDMASIILLTICDVFDGRTDLKKLQEQLCSRGHVRFSSTRPLYNFLKTYERAFRIKGEPDYTDITEEGEIEEVSVEDTLIVEGRPRLQLCIQHSTKAGSCTEGCKSLHICKYFILSECDVRRSGRKCLFGHDMSTEHNKDVMRRAFLQQFPSEILLLLKYRNSTTMPVICDYYNKYKGCSKPDCKFLHICRKYILGKCDPVYPCNRTHDILQTNNILSRYGLAQEDPLEVEHVMRKIENDVDSVLYAKKNPSSERKEVTSAKSPTELKETLHSKSSSSQEVTAEPSTGDPSLDSDLEAELITSSPWDWSWQWKAEDGGWTIVEDSHNFEEKFREYIRAQKMEFTIGNKMSEINFDTMKGRIYGDSPLKFRRVERDMFAPKSKE